MHVLMALTAAATSPVQASAAMERPDLPRTGPATMDVAGVKLGMSAAEARSALARAGYVVERADETQDFEQEVASEVNVRLKGVGLLRGKSRGVSKIVAHGPGREYLTIDFAQWPAGSLAAVVYLSVPQDRQPSEAFRAQVAARYGKATLQPGGYEPRWCTAGDADCSIMSSPSLPNLSVSFPTQSLWLRYGEGTDRQRRQAVKVAVDAKMPPARRSAF
ncbi:hypothetical protein ACFSC3_12960 [Sphingomonas floccifaciens]|uniref:Uncharacterized protein n=1 Tax=Sphingomonas floccifaciens TaxID=1844115 RepID=A0ABW4NIP0_9SPHN